MADPGTTSTPTPEAAETTSFHPNENINQNGSARNDPTSGAGTIEVESEEKKTANTEKATRQAAVVAPVPNIKSKMAKGFRSLLSWGTVSPNPQDANPTAATLFKKVDPAVDGDDCDRDCANCSIHYPRGFKIEEHEDLYGGVKPWEKHLVVATGKSDWVRDVVDEKGSVMQAVGSVKGVKLSASNMPFPHGSTSYADPTTVLLLPAMTMVDGVSPANVPALLRNFVEPSVKNTTLLGTASAAENNNNGQLAEELEKLDIGEIQGGQPEDIPAPTSGPALKARPCPHQVLILLCSQRTRDARCGQSAPLLRREFERHLRPLGLYRDLDDERPGGVGIYFISHVGGHKWSANVIIYRRQNAFGVDGATWAEQDVEQEVKKVLEERKKTPGQWQQDTSAAQCIWLARVKPEDIEGVVKFTVLQGKTVKPEWQLRGGFDREKGLFSW